MDGSSKAQIGVYVAAAVLLVVGGAYLLRGGEESPGGSGAEVALDGAGGGGEAKPARTGGSVYVHVAGAVRRPGMYRLPGGSRVAAAVRRAGGLTRRADLTAFNLAAAVRDGQQVIVPRIGQGGTATASAGAAAGAPGGAPPAGGSAGGGAKVSLATATREQLDGLDGIGPKLAGRIIAYRDQHRGFKSVEELGEVEGIGEKRLAALRKAVRP
jgi:competence protein ComEA